MTEKSVLKYSTPDHILQNLDNSTLIVGQEIDYGYSRLEVAGLLCFLVGAIQVTSDQSVIEILICISFVVAHVHFSTGNYCVSFV